MTAVIAGPGTGKTKTLISKILYLLNYRKVKPSEITAVTFTNKAAKEMQERLQREIGKKQTVHQIQIGTFHRICIELLRKQGIRFTITDTMLARELSNFHYLLVDEFQDISPIQYRLIQLWSQSGRELFVIGDPDQSIYGFRGSDAACFASLQKDYPHAEVIRLTENYRSTAAIVDSAMSVIAHNQGEDRVLHAFCHDGSPVRVVESSRKYVNLRDL